MHLFFLTIPKPLKQHPIFLKKNYPFRFPRRRFSDLEADIKVFGRKTLRLLGYLTFEFLYHDPLTMPSKSFKALRIAYCQFALNYNTILSSNIYTDIDERFFV